MTVQALNNSTQETEAGGSEFEASLVYREFQDSQDYIEKPCLKAPRSVPTLYTLYERVQPHWER